MLLIMSSYLRLGLPRDLFLVGLHIRILKVNNKCTAIILPASRTANVPGWIKFLIVSIPTINGIELEESHILATCRRHLDFYTKVTLQYSSFLLLGVLNIIFSKAVHAFYLKKDIEYCTTKNIYKSLSITVSRDVKH